MLNNIFQKYNVKKIKKSFPTSKTPFLQTIFEIEVDDMKIINELKEKAFHTFKNIERVPKVQLLYIPNDFGISGGELQKQEELNYIRGPEAWELSRGNSNIILGVSESVNTNHEDLIGQSDILNGSSSTFNGHGKM